MLSVIQGWFRRGRENTETLDLIGRIVSITYFKTKEIMSDLKALNDTVDALTATASSLEVSSAATRVDLRNLAEAVIALRGDVAQTDQQAAIDAIREKAAAALAKVNAVDAALRAADTESDKVVADPVVAPDAPVVVAPVVAVPVEPVAVVPVEVAPPVIVVPEVPAVVVPAAPVVVVAEAPAVVPVVADPVVVVEAPKPA